MWLSVFCSEVGLRDWTGTGDDEKYLRKCSPRRFDSKDALVHPGPPPFSPVPPRFSLLSHIVYSIAISEASRSCITSHWVLWYITLFRSHPVPTSTVDVGQPSLRSSPLVIFLSGPPTTSKSNASERSTKLWYPYSPGCLLGSSAPGTMIRGMLMHRLLPLRLPCSAYLLCNPRQTPYSSIRSFRRSASTPIVS